MSKLSPSTAKRLLWTLRLTFVLILLTAAALLIWADVLIGTVAILALAAGLYLIVRWQHGRVAYRCRSCHHEFRVGKAEEFLSPHTPESKLLSCPSCDRTGWCEALTVAQVTAPVSQQEKRPAHK